MADKPISCVVLWVEGEIPEGYDWSASLPEGVALAKTKHEWESSYKVKTFPWSDVYHEINWWITRPMTLDEWSELDDAECKAITSVIGDNFMGTAGPIPFTNKEEE